MNEDYWQGERVRLRGVEMRDAETFAAWEHDGEAERRLDEIHFPLTIERIQAWIATLTAEEPRDDAYHWMIENRTGQTVGVIFTYTCNRHNGTFRYGVEIGREHWGQGFATEAICLILRYYFRELRYQKVTVGVYAFNEGSVKLHEKLGFQQEGRMRRMIYSNGEYHDEYILGMLREEFERLYPEESD